MSHVTHVMLGILAFTTIILALSVVCAWLIPPLPPLPEDEPARQTEKERRERMKDLYIGGPWG